MAPVFEGGKTLPVVASFGSKGAGGAASRFLFGVDQTFAGGDAAVTMAKLYDSRERVNEDDNSRKRFDSGLVLSKVPAANSKRGRFGLKKRLVGLAEPGEVRPFFFGTDSQLGVKLGWNGLGGPYPDTVKIGFQRKEMAVAPVTYTTGDAASTDTQGEHVVRMPSFLATVDNSVGHNGEVRWMQYFATGDSANFLARQPEVRSAMLRRVDPVAYEMTARADQGAIPDILDFAFPNGAAELANIEKLVHGTELKPEAIQALGPDRFREKLTKSWSLNVPTFLKNIQ